MPAYDVRCMTCGHSEERFKTFAQQKEGDTVTKAGCSKCEWPVQIVVFQAPCVSQDATPTRGYGRTANAPALQGVNPGHEPVNASHLGLTKEQCNRLGL